MKGYFSKLSSSERRFIVGVGLMVFLVINIFWIWPHFSDWGTIRGRLDTATGSLATFNSTFDKTNAWGIAVQKMQRAGGNVPAEDQAVQFQRTIQSQAAKSTVAVVSYGRLITRTNQFFTEQIQTITVQAGEKQLVDFLYTLGSGDSLVRVRDLSLHPDSLHQQLQANLTLIASYQKNARAASASKSAPSAKPAPKISQAATSAAITNKFKPVPSKNP